LDNVKEKRAGELEIERKIEAKRVKKQKKLEKLKWM
jgi:hypothetical protein